MIKGFYKWEKLFYLELLKKLSLVIFTFYVLYILIDFSSYFSKSTAFLEQQNFTFLLFHYLKELILKIEILLPFALLIATIKVLSNLNTQFLLVALLAGGYSLKRILTPFILVSLAATLLLLLNNQFFIPYSFKKEFLKKNSFAIEKKVHFFSMPDGSELIFKHFNPNRQEFNSFYWIKSIDEIWYIKNLKIGDDFFIGFYVNHFKREPDKHFKLIASYPKLFFSFSDFKFDLIAKGHTYSDNLSITELYEINFKKANQKQKGQKIESAIAFYRKIFFPWLNLVVVIAIIPYCIRFSRNLPIFLIFAMAIFSLVGIYLLLEALSILGQKQILSPFYAIGLPIVLLISFFIIRLKKCST